MAADVSRGMLHALKDATEKFVAGLYVVQDDALKYANPKFAEICGYTVDEIMARRLEDLIFPEDLPLVKENLRQRIADGTESVRYRFRIITKSGRIRYVEAWDGRTVHDARPAVLGTLVDVTERVEDAEAQRNRDLQGPATPPKKEACTDSTIEGILGESESKYRAMFEHATQAVFQTTPEGRCVTANPAFARMFGYSSPEEAVADMTDIAQQIYENPEKREELKQLLEKNGEVRTFEIEARRKDGEKIWISMTGRAVKDGTGTVRFHEGTFRDITDRKRVEENLLESEERYRTAIEHSNDGVALIKDGRHVYVNRKYLDMFGWNSPDDIMGKTLAAVVHPHDLAMVERYNERRGRGGPSPSCYQTRGIRKDGSDIFLDVSAAATTYRGETVTFAYLRDITERKRDEEMLRWKTALFEAQVNASIDGILVIGNDHKRIITNTRLIAMLGVPQEVLDDESHEALLRFVLTRVKNPEQFLEKVMYLYDHPRETSRDEIKLDNGMTFDWYSAPVLGNNGHYYGKIWSFRDITENKRYWNMLENLSTTDGLTGISNRRRFDEFLGRQWRQCMREGRDISLLFLDIDYFKQFNDLYGHLAGDDCLRRIATVLQTSARRSNDLAARYGGEEFACVLPGTGQKNAMLLAEKIMGKVADLNIPHESSSAARCVTVSIGVATEVPPRGRQYADLIDAADRSLYAAKQQGRNRVVAFPVD
jgi:diguanylate cyclase (GGDEF)-like protein/PAS domain S-box-containing protein